MVLTHLLIHFILRIEGGLIWWAHQSETHALCFHVPGERGTAQGFSGELGTGIHAGAAQDCLGGTDRHAGLHFSWYQRQN